MKVTEEIRRMQKIAGLLKENDDYGYADDPDNYPDYEKATDFQKEYGLSIGDLVIVRDSQKEPERGEIVAFDELVVVKLENGQTVEVSPYAVEKMSDFFNEEDMKESSPLDGPNIPKERAENESWNHISKIFSLLVAVKNAGYFTQEEYDSISDPFLAAALRIRNQIDGNK